MSTVHEYIFFLSLSRNYKVNVHVPSLETKDDDEPETIMVDITVRNSMA